MNILGPKTGSIDAKALRVAGFFGASIPAPPAVQVPRHPKAKANRARNRVARASRKANR